MQKTEALYGETIHVNTDVHRRCGAGCEPATDYVRRARLQTG